jgi:radical SAM protein with 4Fe4S-binding SPASM domain
MYAVIAKERMLYLTPEGGTVFIGNLPLQTVNSTGARILELCTGSYTVEDMCTVLAEEYHDDVTRVKELVFPFLKESEKRGNITFCEGEPHQRPIIAGNKELWVPHYISVEITKNCDLRCIHCYAEAGPPAVNEMSTDQWLHILDELYTLGTRTVNITGGDPLVHPDIFDVLDFCEKRFHIILATSGYLIDEDTAEQLSHYRIDHIQVSLDGPDPETHNAIRGRKDAFQKVVNAITVLTEKNAAVSVAMVVLPENEDKIEDTIKLAKQLKVKTFGTGRIYSLGRAKGKFPLSVEKVMELDKKVMDLSTIYSDETFVVKSRDTNVPGVAGDMSPDEILAFGDALTKAMGGNCGAGYRSVFVTAEGNILPCGMLPHIMGNVAHTSVKEVLLSPLVHAFKKLPAPHTDVCGECLNRFLCSGCPALALQYSHACAWRDIYEASVSCAE